MQSNVISEWNQPVNNCRWEYGVVLIPSHWVSFYLCKKQKTCFSCTVVIITIELVEECTSYEMLFLGVSFFLFPFRSLYYLFISLFILLFYNFKVDLVSVEMRSFLKFEPFFWNIEGGGEISEHCYR